MDKKYFVWNGLRISFWLMFALWILYAIILKNTDDLIIGSLWVASIISTFVFSIIHLVKYRQKTFAITSLCVSSVWLFFFLIGIIVGIIEAI